MSRRAAGARQDMATAVRLLQTGEYRQAARYGQRLLKTFKRDPDVLHLNGAIAMGLGQYDQAQRMIERSLAVRPDHPDALNALGECHRSAGRYPEALARYEAALRLVPHHPGYLSNASVVLLAMDRADDALARSLSAEKAAPGDPLVLINKGNALVALGRRRDGLAAYEQALGVAPNHPEALANAATLMMELGQLQACEARYRELTRLHPQSPKGWLGLAGVLELTGHADQAVATLHRGREFVSEPLDLDRELGKLYLTLGRGVEAVTVLEEAVRRHPQSFDAWLELGNARRTLGDPEGMDQAYARAIKLDGEDTNLLLLQANARRVTADSPLFERLQALDTDREALDVERRVFLDFALGKAFSDQGDFDAAFAHLARANGVRRVETDVVDPVDRELAGLRVIAEVFDDAFFASLEGGCTSELPILIVGMPRSGTTLVEQILAAHSEVFGAGELYDLDRMETALGLETDPPGVPQIYRSLGSERFEELARDYVRRLRLYGGDAARITDKLPHNFQRIGLVRAMLPRARIIQCVRSPVETCFSIYRNYFSDTHVYAHDLSDLGRYYRGYDELMRHWHRVLPGHVHVVDHAELVSDPEPVIRDLLVFCGLDWQDACLRPQDSERVVRTLSIDQVRQPISRPKVTAREQFGDRLQPLLDALGPLAS